MSGQSVGVTKCLAARNYGMALVPPGTQVPIAVMGAPDWES
jgi:hypothetical protein